MKVWSAYLNEAIEVKSVTPERLVDEEIGDDTAQSEKQGSAEPELRGCNTSSASAPLAVSSPSVVQW